MLLKELKLLEAYTATYDQLAQRVKSFLRSGPETNFLMVYGKPGTGKSFTTKAVGEKIGAMPKDRERLYLFTVKDMKKEREKYDEYQDVLNDIKRDQQRKIARAKAQWVAKKGGSKEDFEGEELFFEQAEAFEETQEYKNLLDQLKKEAAEKKKQWIVKNMNDSDQEYYKSLVQQYHEAENPEDKQDLRNYINKELQKNIPGSFMAKLQTAAQEQRPYNGIMRYGQQNPDPDTFYLDLYKNRWGVTVYDDSNESFYNDQKVQDMLLQATQTGTERRISYNTRADKTQGIGYVEIDGSIIPDSFLYSGKIMLITNREPKDLPESLRSRAILFPFNPTKKQMIDQTAAGLEDIKQKYIRNRHDQIMLSLQQGEDPESRKLASERFVTGVIDEVFEWIMQNVAKGSLKFDMRLIDKLIELKIREVKEGIDFDKEAKKMIRQHYAIEQDPVELRLRQLRKMLIANYERETQYKLKKSERDKVNRLLKAMSESELKNTTDVMHRIGLILGNTGIEKLAPEEEEVGAKKEIWTD